MTRNTGKLPPDIVVIGGSAGSIAVLHKIVGRLPQDFSAAVFIAQHISPTWVAASSAELLQSSTKIPVHVAGDLQPFKGGRVYICPPNLHLTIEGGLMHVENSPMENHTRPSIDVLFKSAAAHYGRRVIGVVLSGTLTDGTAGLWQIKKRGRYHHCAEAL